MSDFTLSFHGGTETVTGANFLLEGNDRRILVDCGLLQGEQQCEQENRDPFPYDPRSIDLLLVTHAHIDHIGRIPKLVRDGFSGVIYSTAPTKELAEILLADSVEILDTQARREGILPMYEKADVARALSLWQSVDYHVPVDLGAGITATFKDAGHILGSAMIEISAGGGKLMFTGDLGNSPAPLLKDTESPGDIRYLVMESVYGDRNHEPPEERVRALERVIRETIAQKRTLVIPAFSVDRTQILLFELNHLVETGAIAPVRVFLDSPLAIKATEIYRRHSEAFNGSVQEVLKTDKNVFDFPRLHMTPQVDDSRDIAQAPNPKIIIAGSGMSGGGRIIFHERHYLPDPQATFLLVGYQAVGTLGRKIQDGVKKLRILGESVTVRAQVQTIRGYSSHKDSDRLVEFVEQTAPTLERTFVVMGEPRAALFLVQKIRDTLGVEARAPHRGESVLLTL